MHLYLIIGAGVLTVGVVLALALGLFNFAQDGDAARRRSNKMMQWRVGLQLAAVVALMTLIFLGGR